MTAQDFAPLIEPIAANATAAYPAECCGIVLADASGGHRFVPIPNIAGSAAAQGNSSRSARHGYVMEPKALLAALESAEAEGGRLAAIVHSHPDVGAYFSKEDRDMALGGGDAPLWPEVQYLVVSCKKGRVDGARLYTWDAARRDFQEQQVAVLS